MEDLNANYSPNEKAIYRAVVGGEHGEDNKKNCFGDAKKSFITDLWRSGVVIC